MPSPYPLAFSPTIQLLMYTVSWPVVCPYVAMCSMTHTQESSCGVAQSDGSSKIPMDASLPKERKEGGMAVAGGIVCVRSRGRKTTHIRVRNGNEMNKGTYVHGAVGVYIQRIRIIVFILSVLSHFSCQPTVEGLTVFSAHKPEAICRLRAPLLPLYMVLCAAAMFSLVYKPVNEKLLLTINGHRVRWV